MRRIFPSLGKCFIMPDMKLYLIRHGQTAYNLQHRYTGCRDIPLSPRGEAEVRARGAYPPVEAVAVSPLLRARQTAALLFPRALQRVYPDLREIQLGSFEGRTAAELENDPAYRAWVEGNCLDAPTGAGGESTSAFISRASAAFVQAARDAQARGETRLITVSHGGAVRAALTAFCEEKRESLFDWPAPNVCCYEAEFALSGPGAPLITGVRLMDALPF